MNVEVVAGDYRADGYQHLRSPVSVEVVLHWGDRDGPFANNGFDGNIPPKVDF